MKKILILEDERAISDFIEINMVRAGYATVTARTGEEALEIVEKNEDIAIALLDVMLPGIDGFEVCRRIRAMGRGMGIIMLSAKAEEMDRVTGLMRGADDYVPKPFSPLELTARVDALARRVGTDIDANYVPPVETLTSGDFVLDLRSRILLKGKTQIELTQVEFIVLKYFFENRGKAISREEMLNAVWGEDYVGDAKIVDVNLRRLRLKVENDPANPKHLVAVWGYGYKWVD